jgi:hypothetical protein
MKKRIVYAGVVVLTIVVLFASVQLGNTETKQSGDVVVDSLRVAHENQALRIAKIEDDVRQLKDLKRVGDSYIKYAAVFVGLLSIATTILLFVVGLAWKDIRGSADEARKELTSVREELEEGKNEFKQTRIKMIDQVWGQARAFVSAFAGMVPEEQQLDPLLLSAVLQLYDPQVMTRRAGVLFLHECGDERAVRFLEILADRDSELKNEADRAVAAIRSRIDRKDETPDPKL